MWTGKNSETFYKRSRLCEFQKLGYYNVLYCISIIYTLQVPTHFDGPSLLDIFVEYNKRSVLGLDALLYRYYWEYKADLEAPVSTGSGLRLNQCRHINCVFSL